MQTVENSHDFSLLPLLNERFEDLIEEIFRLRVVLARVNDDVGEQVLVEVIMGWIAPLVSIVGLSLEDGNFLTFHNSLIKQS